MRQNKGTVHFWLSFVCAIYFCIADFDTGAMFKNYLQKILKVVYFFIDSKAETVAVK
jgi:hypothetical protein